MHLILGLGLVLCVASVINAKTTYEFTNEQVNCRFTEEKTKMICNLSGNVECEVTADLPESILKDETVDMLVIGFQKGEKNLSEKDLSSVKLTLYPSNVNNKEIVKLGEPLLMYLGDGDESAKGIVVKEEKCFDKLTQLFKVVEMIKKTQKIKFKDANSGDHEAEIYGEILLKQ